MPDPRVLARRLGVAVELADLGDWGSARLVSEYDPHGPLVRVNTRELPSGTPVDVRAHVDGAIAHELYHHLEATGTVERRRPARARETSAAEFRP